jgi:hypothetical protein
MITFLRDNKIMKNIKSEDELIDHVKYKHSCQYLEDYEIFDFEEKNLDTYDDGKYFVRKDDSYILIEKITKIRKGYLYDDTKIIYNILDTFKVLEVIDDIIETSIYKEEYDLNKITTKTKNIMIGPINCGKTTRIRNIIKHMKNKYTNIKVYADSDYSDIIDKSDILESLSDIKGLTNTFIIIDKFKSTNKFLKNMRDSEIKRTIVNNSNGFIISMTFPIIISTEINKSIDNIFMYEYNREFITKILNRRYCPHLSLEELKKYIKCEKEYDVAILDRKKDKFFRI